MNIKILKMHNEEDLHNGIKSINSFIEFTSGSDIFNIKFTVYLFEEKNKKQNNIFYKKISNISKNGIQINNIIKNSKDYNTLISNFFISRNNHYIPQKIIESWMTGYENYYTLNKSENKYNKKYHFEKRSTETIFTIEDGYIFVDGNELITIEDGFISFIENTHIFKLRDYVNKTKKTKQYSDTFLKKNEKVIKNISILFYYNILINNRNEIFEIFKSVITNTIYCKNYHNVSEFYSNMSLNYLKTIFPNSCFWGICKLKENSFLLTDSWMFNFIKSKDNNNNIDSMSLVIPITPKVAFVFARNQITFKEISDNMDLHLLEYNKAVIQYLFDGVKKWDGVLCPDKKSKQFVENYASSLDDFLFCQKKELPLGLYTKQIYDNINSTNWTTKTALISYNIKNK